MASGGSGDREIPRLVRYESESSDIDNVIVIMPNGDIKETRIPMLPNPAAHTPREAKLGVPSESVRDRMNQLLRESNYPEDTFQNYEMLIIASQGIFEVMQDNSPISAYREQMATGRDTRLEIRKRADRIPVRRESNPDEFNYQLKAE